MIPLRYTSFLFNGRRMLFALLLGAVHVVQAGSPTTVEVKKFLDEAMGEPVTVQKTFPAPMELTGVVVNTSRAENIVLYVDKNLRHFIVGMLFDDKGQNLTAGYIEQNMPNVALEAAMSQLEKLPSVEEGNANAPLLYVVADPNCPYCKQLHDIADRDLREGRVRIRWVLTSTLGHDGKSEAIYSIDKRIPGQGAEMLRQYYMGMGDEKPEYDEDGARSVAKANRYFQDMGIKGTPFIMYRTRSGNISMHMGAPEKKVFEQIVSTL